MHRDELRAWLRLLETPGVGRESARKLLAAFGSPESVVSASASDLRQVVTAPVASAFSTADPKLYDLLHQTELWLGDPSAEEPRSIVTLGDPRYPSELLQTADPPLLLYAQGEVTLLQRLSVAMVGSRSPTPQGLENAKAFSTQLSEADITVVSGLAMGIDGAAHEGALMARGSTIAVVGTGLDRVYPRRHLSLARRIAKVGLIVSEFSVGTPPIAAHFPMRNRIIAGLSRGTLVVEAALQSGSLITARLASEAGRDVFAIPGSIHAPQSRGCHALIKQGAKLVECTEDVLEELHSGQRQLFSESEAVQPATSDPILDAMGFEPINLDALIARVGWPAAELSARLLELELTSQVARLPGQLFQRINAA